MRTCKRATSFDLTTGAYELCGTDIEDDVQPVMVGLHLAGETIFMAADFCTFHIIAAQYQQGIPPSSGGS